MSTVFQKGATAWILLLVLGCVHASATLKKDILLADPTIFFDDGTYYLYGTVSGSYEATAAGFPVYTSTDLKNWEGPVGATDGFALKPEHAFGERGFWAPQVFKHKGKYYMAYTANENIAIAMSDSPLGPFKNEAKKAYDAPTKQIDPFIFFDDDGKIYLYYVRVNKGNTLCVAELSDDLMRIQSENRTVCLSGDQPWENTEGKKNTITEGPTMIKHDGIYYLIYSANDFRNPDYCVGYATSKSPTGPWKKAEVNPVIHRSVIGENGTGHGDLIQGKDGKYLYVLHTHWSKEEIRPRKTAIVDAAFSNDSAGHTTITIDKETFRFLQSTGK